jgi:hypothetical protein
MAEEALRHLILAVKFPTRYFLLFFFFFFFLFFSLDSPVLCRQSVIVHAPLIISADGSGGCGEIDVSSWKVDKRTTFLARPRSSQ